MATKITQYDDGRVGGGQGLELDLDADLARDGSGESSGALAGTPTSVSSKGDGQVGKGGVGNDDHKDDDDEEESGYEDMGDEASFPLQQLKHGKQGKQRKQRGGSGGDGAGDGGGLRPGFKEDEGEVLYDNQESGDELVVRWSQDGGSPTSFRKLREQHRRGSVLATGERKQRTKRGRRRPADGSDGEGGIRDIFYTPEDERKVVKKMDKYLVGFLAGLYMLSFLDRSNIGNARIAGLEEDLGLTGDQYEWLLTAFYITYISFEWMAMLWKVLPAHKYVAWCVAGWGFIASTQALAWDWRSMMVFRALLGIFEAAFGPGVPFYLSFFYRREELALRIGLFISAAPLATAYAGTLAYLITSIPSHLAPWRMLLIAEGFPSLIVAVVAWYWIPDSPGEQRWLGRREREIARRRVMVVRDGGGNDEEEEEEDNDDDGMGGVQSREEKGVKWKEVWMALADGKNWITAMIFFSCNVAFSSLPVYLPTILHDMGYTRLTSQALSAPPYLLAFISVIVTTYLSDRARDRSFYIIAHSLLAFSGYFFLTLAPTSITSGPYATWGYLAIYPISTGVFSVVACVIPWTLNNQDTESKRGTGMIVLNVVGQMGPLLGTRVYPRGVAGGNKVGMGVCAVAMLCVAGLAGWLRVLLRRENDKRRAWRGRGRAKGMDFIL